MNLDRLRNFCLSFPNAKEKLQWDEELCFKVGGKIFAMVALGAVENPTVFKCDPETFAELTEREGVVPAPYVGRYKWVMIEHLDAFDDLELQDLIGKSYEMVSANVKRPTVKPARETKPSRLKARSRHARNVNPI